MVNNPAGRAVVRKPAMYLAAVRMVQARTQAVADKAAGLAANKSVANIVVRKAQTVVRTRHRSDRPTPACRRPNLVARPAGD